MIYQEARKANPLDPYLAVAAGIGTGLLVHKGFDTLGWQGNFLRDVGNIGISSWLGFASLVGSYFFLSPAVKLPKSEINADQRHELRRMSSFGLLYGVSAAALSYVGMSSIHAMPDTMNAVAAGGLGAVNAYGFRKGAWSYIGKK